MPAEEKDAAWCELCDCRFGRHFTDCSRYDEADLALLKTDYIAKPCGPEREVGRIRNTIRGVSYFEAQFSAWLNTPKGQYATFLAGRKA